MDRRFIQTVLSFASIGLIGVLFLLVGYVWFDPFKVIHERANFSNEPPEAVANRDFISTEMYLKNRQTQRYDSFIFGSSRALAFRPSHWVKYLGPEARPFQFNASGESLCGITSKVEYLDSTGAEIVNALVVLCRDFSFVPKHHHEGPLFIKHPVTSGDGWLGFHWTFFSAYFDPSFLAAFYTQKVTGNYYPWMSKVLANHKLLYDPVTNETSVPEKEKEIVSDPESFYAARRDVFYDRSTIGHATESMIQPEHLDCLRRMQSIFARHRTHVQIVISPLYEQKALSPTDLEVIRGIFGDVVFDASGVNAYTNDLHNYYEVSHYRPVVGDTIMSLMYAPRGGADARAAEQSSK